MDLASAAADGVLPQLSPLTQRRVKEMISQEEININEKFPIEQENNRLVRTSSFRKTRKWKSDYFISLTMT